MALVRHFTVFLLALNLAHTLKVASPEQRKVWGWVPHRFTEASEQLEANADVFDGIYLWCGLEVNTTVPTRPFFYVSGDYWSTACQSLVQKVKELGLSLHMGVSLGSSPQVTPVGLESSMDMSAIAESSVALAKKHGWGGINLDDESQTCPRKDPVAFEAWVKNLDVWAAALEGAGLKLTVDVQSLTCSACSPWPDCLPPPGTLPGSDLQPALKHIRDMLGSSSVHRWIEMDTYWGGTDYFQEQLDWYSKWLTPEELTGMGICPNQECNPTNASLADARIAGVKSTAITEIDIWRLPLDAEAQEVWLPRLREWKHA